MLIELQRGDIETYMGSGTDVIVEIWIIAGSWTVLVDKDVLVTVLDTYQYACHTSEGPRTAGRVELGLTQGAG